jgi:5-methylcytosine-specific restriction endonuclease McrA
MHSDAITKRCPTCKETKLLDAFSVSKDRRDGRQGECRACRGIRGKRYDADHAEQKSAYRRAYYLENRERLIRYGCDYAKAKRLADPEDVRAKARAHYAANPEQARARRYDYVKRNPDKIKAYTKRRYESDPERWKALAKVDYLTNREKWQDRHSKWIQKNRDHVMAYQRRYNEENRTRKNEVTRKRRASMTKEERRAQYLRNRDNIIQNRQRRRARVANAPQIERIDTAAIAWRDGYRCYLCGKALTRKQITLDHVIPLARGGTHTADNLRVACRSCNCRKGTKLLSELKVTP